MTTTEAYVLITDEENITKQSDILARGQEALTDANPGETVTGVTLAGSESFDGYKSYHFRIGG